MPEYETDETAHQPMGELETLRAFQALASNLITTRSQLGGFLGYQYGNERNLYQQCGYPESITFEQYHARFKRDGIAKRVVKAYPEATWRGEVLVYETEDEDVTEFERSWAELLESVRVVHYLKRADILSGVGRYGVLFLGYDDQQPLEQPVQPAKGRRLLYMQAYTEGKASVTKWVTDKNDPRYGKPELYKIEISIEGVQENAMGTSVHHSRVLHLADDVLESDVYGTPRLEAVWNYLLNLDKIAGGSGEGFWRAAVPGISLEAQPGVEVQNPEAVKTQLKNFMHGLSREFTLEGIEAKELMGRTVDPDGHIDGQLKMISGASTIPVRILTGSERGEMASTQDRENWSDRVGERRSTYAEPMILMRFIEQLQAAQVLPEAPQGVNVAWPEVQELPAKDRAEIAKARTEALKAYTDSGASQLVPPFLFLTLYLGHEPDEARTIIEEALLEAAQEEPPPEPPEPPEKPAE